MPRPASGMVINEPPLMLTVSVPRGPKPWPTWLIPTVAMPCAASDQGDRPAIWWFAAGRQHQGEVNLVVVLHERGPGARSHRRNVLARMHVVVGRDVIAVRDCSNCSWNDSENPQIDGRRGEAIRVQAGVLFP